MGPAVADARGGRQAGAVFGRVGGAGQRELGPFRAFVGPGRTWGGSQQQVGAAASTGLRAGAKAGSASLRVMTSEASRMS